METILTWIKKGDSQYPWGVCLNDFSGWKGVFDTTHIYVIGDSFQCFSHACSASSQEIRIAKQSVSEREGRGPETQICWRRSTIPQNLRAFQEMSLCDYFISDSVLGSCSHSGEVGLCYPLIRLSQGPVSTVKAEHFLSLCSLWVQQGFWMQILYRRLEMRLFLLTVEQGPEHNKMCMHTASIFIQALCIPTTLSPGTENSLREGTVLFIFVFLAIPSPKQVPWKVLPNWIGKREQRAV